MSRMAVTLTQLTQPHPVIGFIHIPLQHHNQKEGQYRSHLSQSLPPKTWPSQN